jgi:hypothetical protein
VDFIIHPDFENNRLQPPIQPGPLTPPGLLPRRLLTTLKKKDLLKGYRHFSWVLKALGVKSKPPKPMVPKKVRSRRSWWPGKKPWKKG